MKRTDNGRQPSQSAVTDDARPPAEALAFVCAAPRCGAVYLDYPAAVAAHKEVFGHAPQSKVLAREGDGT
jgi:hypothetical protein